MKGMDFMEQKLRQINDISLGNNLRNLRNAANLTQEQVNYNYATFQPHAASTLK